MATNHLATVFKPLPPWFLGLLEGTLRDYHRDPFRDSLLRTRETSPQALCSLCPTQALGRWCPHREDLRAISANVGKNWSFSGLLF